MAIKTYKKGSKTRVATNFLVSEFCCKGNDCCVAAKIDTALVEVLQKIREHFGVPVTINSAYRCEKHNKAVGGAKNSYHTKGMAADIVATGVKPLEIARYAESIGVKGIGLYDDFVHVDTRENKSFWYSHKEEKRTTFFDENPIKKWQQAAIMDGFVLKFGADGIWGAECEALAKKALCQKEKVGYKNTHLVKIIQNAVGVTADGKFGKDTKNAVIKYQKSNALESDGIVGYNTWKKILGVAK
ncbi:MAG: peptidoglycan-binding protein [Clostridia bacterium]|nr:peptidoglycan-binding protein [Clostridia bacterium]